MLKPAMLTKINELMRRDAEYFTDEFSDKIGNMSGRCIDIGTGAGDVTVDFILPKLKANSTLLCSDISEAMVNYGKETYGNNKRLEFMKLNIETPELPKDLVGQFDHLTSLGCVHWCHDMRRAFENMYSLLRPGGTGFVSFLSSFPGLSAYADLQAIPKYQSFTKDAHRCIPPFQKVQQPRKLLMNLLRDVGFEVEICSWRPMSYVHETVDSLRELLIAASPCKLDDMPPGLRDEFVRDVTRKFMEYEIVFNKDPSKKDDRSVLIRYTLFVVYMRKPLGE